MENKQQEERAVFEYVPFDPYSDPMPYRILTGDSDNFLYMREPISFLSWVDDVPIPYTLSRYTYFNDYYGEPIYEGDIVESIDYSYGKYKQIGVVVLHDGAWCLAIPDKSIPDRITYYRLGDQYEVSEMSASWKTDIRLFVRGNIFQNKDILPFSVEIQSNSESSLQ